MPIARFSETSQKRAIILLPKPSVLLSISPDMATSRRIRLANFFVLGLACRISCCKAISSAGRGGILSSEKSGANCAGRAGLDCFSGKTSFFYYYSYQAPADHLLHANRKLSSGAGDISIALFFFFFHGERNSIILIAKMYFSSSLAHVDAVSHFQIHVVTFTGTWMHALALPSECQLFPGPRFFCRWVATMVFHSDIYEQSLWQQQAYA